MGDTLILDQLDNDTKFDTLLGKTVSLRKGDLVFYNKNKEVINLAGIVGGDDTACSKDTRSVVVDVLTLILKLLLERQFIMISSQMLLISLKEIRIQNATNIF